MPAEPRTTYHTTPYRGTGGGTRWSRSVLEDSKASLRPTCVEGIFIQWPAVVVPTNPTVSQGSLESNSSHGKGRAQQGNRYDGPQPRAPPSEFAGLDRRASMLLTQLCGARSLRPGADALWSIWPEAGPSAQRAVRALSGLVGPCSFEKGMLNALLTHVATLLTLQQVPEACRGRGTVIHRT